MRHNEAEGVELVPTGPGTNSWAVNKVLERFDLVELEVESLRPLVGWSDGIIDQALECLDKARDALEAGDVSRVKSELNNAEARLWEIRPPKHSYFIYRCSLVARNQFSAAWSLVHDVFDVVRLGE